MHHYYSIIVKIERGVKMKTITVYGLDDKLDELIRQKAKIQGMSLNKIIIKSLKQSLGIINTHEQIDHKKEFLDLFSVWSKEEEKQFNKNISNLEKSNNEDW